MSEGDFKTKNMYLNIGPSHPTMHGTLRIFAEMDGERIVSSVAEMGYLHRGFEKHSEAGTYTQVIPYTDRLNYVSPLMNNVGYCMAVEKLIGCEIPERAQTIRVIICELSRITDHLVCIGTNVVDLGALTNFWYYFNVREKIYDFIEKICGARLTTNYTRIGGVSRDLYPEAVAELAAIIKDVQLATKEVRGLLERNKIFVDRTLGIAPISQEEAINYGFTGPCLRATGCDYDVRKSEPYCGYENYDFDIPVGEDGDTYDRFLVRFEEINQSIRIIEQAISKLRPGPVMTSDRRVALPPKAEVYTNIEALMNHFKLIYEGVRPPPGEVYSATEAANGELGFYIVSDGSTNPYRVKCRPPCFPLYAAYPRLVNGVMLADAIAVMGSINIIAGELDR
ncbi:MAG: NADH dehydrogenase (quinone) subunit D [Deltaproteobacteria bacterium]|nr:NADH dehydrogenase (quinone) subunit D [Deltaproteobacteria bacterium]